MEAAEMLAALTDAVARRAKAEEDRENLIVALAERGVIHREIAAAAGISRQMVIHILHRHQTYTLRIQRGE